LKRKIQFDWGFVEEDALTERFFEIRKKSDNVLMGVRMLFFIEGSASMEKLIREKNRVLR